MTDTNRLRSRVVRVLRSIYDPEIPVDIWELGLIYDVSVALDGSARVEMTLTSPNCPMAEEIPAEVERAVAGVPGIRSVHLDLVWEPPWDPEMMSEAARLELGMDW